MGGLIDSVGDFIFGGDEGDASIEAAGIQAGTQREALDYLKERERLPQGYREEALKKLGGLYGFEEQTSGDFTAGSTAGSTRTPIYETRRVRNPEWDPFRPSEMIGVPQYIHEQVQTGWEDQPGGQGGLIEDEQGNIVYTGDTSGQQELIDQALESPLYGALIGGQELGEEAIMRHSGMTGGLRSGNVQGNMYDYITQLQNRALLASYNEQLGGLQGLSGLPSNVNQIAGAIAGIGTTQAQGILGGAQSESMANQQRMNTMLGIGGVAAMFSDRRLKKNIQKLGKINGYNFYSFNWNYIANELGLTGSTCGCMADEVYNKIPNAVFLKNNFMMVNYSMIGVL